MTAEEFAKLAAAIKTYFPKENILPTSRAMELWYDMLKDITYKDAYIGLKYHVATSRFAPTIADIRKGAELNQPKELNEMEAWALVSRAIRNSAYHAVEEYAKLPPLVQRAVGLPEQLRIWGTDDQYNENVISSNFIKTYRNVVERQSESSKIPKDVKAIAQNGSEGSYLAQIETLREETIKVLDERKKSEIKLSITSEQSCGMPEQVRMRWEEIIDEK